MKQYIEKYTQARDYFLSNVNFISHGTRYQLLFISIVAENRIKRNDRQFIEVSERLLSLSVYHRHHTCIYGKRRHTDIAAKDKKLTTPAYVTGHAGSVRSEKVTAWLTLTVGVRGRNDNCEQHRKDQHQFARHRCTATTATAAADDGGDDGASRIARHVPETRTRLAGWLAANRRWSRLTRTSWQRTPSHVSSHVGCIASVARACTHHTLVTDHPTRLPPFAPTVTTALKSAATPTSAVGVSGGTRHRGNGRTRTITSALEFKYARDNLIADEVWFIT